MCVCVCVGGGGGGGECEMLHRKCPFIKVHPFFLLARHSTALDVALIKFYSIHVCLHYPALYEAPQVMLHVK